MSRSARPQPPDGEFRYRHPIEIRFVDTDALGHVNNAVYLSYFEAARAGYYAAVTGSAFGRGPNAARTTFVIAEARITYRSQAVFGERLVCSCRVGWAGRSSFGLEYRIDAEASDLGQARLVADGSTVQVLYDLAGSRILRLPVDLVARMVAHEGRAIPPRSQEV